MRLTCRSVRDLLPLHCGGDLPPEKAIVVDQHLHACLACFREYRDYAAMRGRLGVLAEEPLPQGALDGFTEEVMARLVVAEEGPAAELPSASRWRRLDVPAVRLAAAAALVLAVGFGVWQADLLPRFGEPAPQRNLLRDSLAAETRAPLETARDDAFSRPPAQPVPAIDGLRNGVHVESPAAPPIILVDPEHMPAVLLQIPVQLLPPGALQHAPADEGLHPEAGRQLRPRERN
jgi:hypothetical protein